MPALSLRLPNSLHDELRAVAHEDGVSINQFVALAVAEKVAAMNALRALRRRAARAAPEGMAALLAQVPDQPPMPGDELDRDTAASMEALIAQAGR